jgi:hypothetical protein
VAALGSAQELAVRAQEPIDNTDRFCYDAFALAGEIEPDARGRWMKVDIGAWLAVAQS